MLASVASVNIKLFFVVLYYAAKSSLQHRQNHTKKSNQILESLVQRDNGIYEIKAVKSCTLCALHICIRMSKPTCNTHSLFHYDN